MKPLVSVVMSVYNTEPYLSQTVESILSQSFKDFEFIIIDDGSTDASSRLLKKYADKDKRIKLICQNNQGLVASLNHGIQTATGEYIARQDADDTSAPDRLKRQVDFLKKNPQVVIVGSSISVMNEQGTLLHQHALLLHDTELRQELLVRSPFAHGAVIFRRQAAVDAGLYDQTSWPVEDYDLWLRLSQYGQLANLDQYLYIYREHTLSISSKNTQLQRQKLAEVQAKAWQARQRLLPKYRINLSAYKNLDMGQLRVERIFDNSLFISRAAWRHNQKGLALKTMPLGNKVFYRKAAGKLKRRIRS